MDSIHYNDCKETSTQVGFPAGELVELTVVPNMSPSGGDITFDIITKLIIASIK